MQFRFKDFFYQYVRKSWLTYTLIFIFFMSGIIFGSLGVRAMKLDQATDLGNSLNVFLSNLDKAHISNWSLALDVVEKNLLMVLAIYILGLTIIGVPVIMLIIFTRGFRLGFTIGFLIHAKQAKGVLLILTSIIPHNLIYIPVYIIAAATSVAFSVSLVRGQFVHRTMRLPSEFVKYTLFMGILAVLVAVGGLIEAYMTPGLVKLVAGYIN